MVRKNAVQHGTPQGYKKHLKGSHGWNLVPCAACKDAHNAEIAAYRERKGRDRTQDNLRRAARSRALSRLSECHPRDYELLLAEELEKTGTSR